MFHVEIYTLTLGWSLYTVRKTEEEALEVGRNLPSASVYRVRFRDTTPL
jgi:hypothetical protein